MTPTGYMAKRLYQKPDYLRAEQVRDIYSVSGCISSDFADYIPRWKHNGYWLFDSPEIIREVAIAESATLEGTLLFFTRSMNSNSTGRTGSHSHHDRSQQTSLSPRQNIWKGSTL
jgi:hypothetical protein